MRLFLCSSLSVSMLLPAIPLYRNTQKNTAKNKKAISFQLARARIQIYTIVRAQLFVYTNKKTESQIQVSKMMFFSEELKTF